jgi:hypothetical protein
MVVQFNQRDWDKIELYMKSGSLPTSIAKAMGCTLPTLKRLIEERYEAPYMEVVDKFNETGCILLRVKQFQQAMEGSTQMLSWLGKVRLAQREPEPSVYLAPAQEEINKDHVIMELKHEVKLLKDKLKETDANK